MDMVLSNSFIHHLRIFSLVMTLNQHFLSCDLSNRVIKALTQFVQLQELTAQSPRGLWKKRTIQQGDDSCLK